MEYKEPLPTCDKILSIINGKTAVSETELYTGLQSSSPEWVNTGLAITKLIDDEKIFKASNSYYRLKGDTLHFIEDGGYKTFVVIENERQAKKGHLEKLNEKTNENVILTGESVQSLNKVLKPATISQVLLSIVTIIIASLAAYIAFLGYKENTTTNDVKERLQSLEKSINRIEEQIQKIQQRPMKDTVYMIAIPKKK